MIKSLDYIAGLEKAVEEKYGKEALESPYSKWSKDKEEKYIKERDERELNDLKGVKEAPAVEKSGFLIKQKLFTNTAERKCPTCEEYSFTIRDDVYMCKFACCYKCYIQYVEGREQKWLLKGEKNAS